MLDDVVDDTEDRTARGSIDLLLRRSGSGDQAAFAELYDAVSARVFGLVKRLLVDRAQAEEVTQEVFLEIWQSAAKFNEQKGNAVSWMLTIAHRRSVDRIRSSQASHDRDLAVGVRDIEAPRDGVSELAELRIEHERVLQALATLSATHREAISLAYYGGLSQSEVAERLSVPLGTVKTRVRDGLARLREALGVTS
ncbi:ECF RNA polymerase sigma factor SigK [Humidisolicoccus flavus]|uniref:ECF RNA polymerase sigma factor SigK n=1 Tax=Humidisolicoccus flavus TaxID=3111414 RepID=UPI0032562B82